MNHGAIDFSGVDFVKNKTVEAVNSEQGQQYVQETKEISQDVFSQLFHGIANLITGGSDDEEDNGLQEATLLSCVDGDTIKVSIDGTETTVRLIGIDAPESVNPDESLNTEYGTMASEYTSNILSNVSKVYLEYDVSVTDTYGRTLAYVWLSNTTESPETNMLNAILVDKGYAVDVVYMPNNKYSDLFLQLSASAEESNAGLWEYEEFTKLYANNN